MLTVTGSLGIAVDTHFNPYINDGIKNIIKNWGRVLVSVPNEPGRYPMFDLDKREKFYLKVEEI